MKQSIRFFCVVAALAVLGFAATRFFGAHAQSTTPLPVDEFIAQITTSSGNSYVGGISGDGRFVVIESTGDIGTDDPAAGLNFDNSDGNREIFLFDYAQRRVFQITNTRSALITPAPTPSPSPAPGAPETIEVEVSNNRPTISNDNRFIAFTSNAATPASFDGNDAANRAALAADGNQEIFLYQIPETASVDLSSGAEPVFTNLSAGTFTRVTDTPASALPRRGAVNFQPFVADDNRYPALNDDASVVAFTSTRTNPTLPGVNNPDGSPEVVLYNRATGLFSQLTNTPLNASPTGALNPIFNENPSISGDGTKVAFVSNANITDTVSGSANNADNNAEVYLAQLATPGGAAQSLRQVTRTQSGTSGVVNVFSPGRRMSRDGQFLAFESTANLEGDNAVQSASGLYVIDIRNQNAASLPARLVLPRSTSVTDVLRFPTFVTETTLVGTTNTLVFTSVLNFRADGTAPDANNSGLNPPASGSTASRPQIFAANLTSNSFVRLTSVQNFNNITQPFTSNTRSRIAFSIANTELGGGNTDNSAEGFYLLTRVRPDASPTPTPAPGAITYFTGASLRPVAAATASPTPTPSPLPADAPVGGVAPGMLVVARATDVALAPAPGVTAQSRCQPDSACASENRRPALPVELNGVSVSVGGAAAGLAFVSPTQIDFIVPPGLAPNLYTIVIYNNGAFVRSQIRVVAAQPDLVTSTRGAGGRAAATNVTGTPPVNTGEPFTVTTTYTTSTGEVRTDPTRLLFMLTGVRGVAASAITVRIGSTALTGAAIADVRPSQMPGFDQITVILPATLAAAGEVPVIVEVSTGGGVTTSRPAETAPRITIN